MKAALWNRMLRMPFLTVSILPYLYGAAIAGEQVRFSPFLLGLAAVASAHLAANLANDYGDAISGADDRDLNHYGFFGGAKLIQTGVLTARSTAITACVFAIIAVMTGGAAVVLTGHIELTILLVVGLLLGVGYTLPPLRLGYRRLGEIAVFLLFGPICVVAGAGLQGVTPGSMRVWALSLPFGFLAASVLAANEVPDAETDRLAGKCTLVSSIGAARGYALYLGLALAAVATVAGCVIAGALHWLAWAAVAAVPFIWKAGRILRKHYGEKTTLLSSSRLAAAVHAGVGLILIAAGVL